MLAAGKARQPGTFIGSAPCSVLGSISDQDAGGRERGCYEQQQTAFCYTIPSGSDSGR